MKLNLQQPNYDLVNLKIDVKTALLNKQQEEKINALINGFIADVEKNGFSKYVPKIFFFLVVKRAPCALFC